MEFEIIHDRKDLAPNVCAVYTEEEKRGNGVAGALLNFACADMKENGIDILYLITDHTSFYERYGWEFLCMVQGDGEPDNALLENIDKLHTTEMGIARIKRNLSLEAEDVVEWCRLKILDASSVIERKGKNWYVNIEHCEITVNAHSYTIITAHRR